MPYLPATAIVWGMLAYSLATLGLVAGLAIKLALLYRDKGELRRQLDASHAEVKELTKACDAAGASLARMRAEVKGLRDELDATDADLDPGGVAARLERLLSSKVREGEDGDGGAAVPAPGGPDSE
jgi:hypothetical protein